MDYLELLVANSDGLPKLLYDLNISLLFSTYQAGRVVCIGSTTGESLVINPYPFKRPMGVAIQGSKMAIATLDEIHFLSSKGAAHKSSKNIASRHDGCFVHRATYNTNKLDLHDIDFGHGVLWGINTAFSCLCKFDVNYSFNPKWVPNFISELVPEDRCHLNGLAMEGALPKYVTALGKTNSRGAWREDIMTGGVVMEVPSGEIILDNLAMPHSPRLIDGKLYVLETGKGNLLKYDPETKTQELVYHFGFFIRGMAHINGLLFIGTSKIRKSSSSFNKLAVKDNPVNAGFIVFSLEENKILETFEYSSMIDEIFDVQILEGMSNPLLINNRDERRDKIISCPSGIFWKKDKGDAS